MHSNFQELDTSHLIDLLATHTSSYNKYVKDGADPRKIELTKVFIEELEKEINSRKETDPNTSITDENIKFEEKDEDTTDIV